MLIFLLPHILICSYSACMTKKGVKVNITERALIQRINRKLGHDNQRLQTTRDTSRWIHDLGRYSIVDLQRNAICAQDVDLQELGKELGVLRAWETVAE